jgi:hypothetical protein
MHKPVVAGNRQKCRNARRGGSGPATLQGDAGDR